MAAHFMEMEEEHDQVSQGGEGLGVWLPTSWRWRTIQPAVQVSQGGEGLV
jgi:hypothetical protein